MHTFAVKHEKNHATLNAGALVSIALLGTIIIDTRTQGTLSAILIETPQIAQRILKLI